MLAHLLWPAMIRQKNEAGMIAATAGDGTQKRPSENLARLGSRSFEKTRGNLASRPARNPGLHRSGARRRRSGEPRCARRARAQRRSRRSHWHANRERGARERAGAASTHRTQRLHARRSSRSSPPRAPRSSPPTSIASATSGLPRDWSPAQGLDARQAETVRKMLLAVVSDPRLVLAQLAQQLVRLRHAKELSRGSA